MFYTFNLSLYLPEMDQPIDLYYRWMDKTEELNAKNGEETKHSEEENEEDHPDNDDDDEQDFES